MKATGIVRRIDTLVVLLFRKKSEERCESVKATRRKYILTLTP